MSLREALATNLARLCHGEDSIASVCRSTKINRQQFNRYLSGRSLPNQRNMKKICRFFGIDESELFRGPRESRAKGPFGELASWSYEDTRAALKLLHSEGPASISPGLYFAHFADPHDPKSVMRSTVVVRRDGSHLTFRRLTCMSEVRGSWWSHFSSDHKGIILERRHWLYFLGLNSLGDREPTLLALRYVPSADPLLGGHAALLTPIGPTVTAVVLNRCDPRMSLRAAIKASHAYSVDDSSIDPIILEALDQQCRSLIATVRRLDLSVTLLSLLAS
jgi:transcriptional regulator with XRE-family HTH domain